MENAREELIRHETHPRGARTAGEMAPGDMCLSEYVDRIAGELHERVEHQRAVLRNALCERASGERIPYCPLVDCARIERLRSVIRETVGVLEETRSAFKSKRLEVMRRKLCGILAER